MRNQILIQEAFRVYDRKMTRIYQELNSIKESYSISEQRKIQLIFEGIFSSMANALKSGFEKTTGTAGKIVGNIMKAGEETYNKAVELGKKAMEATKEFYNKVSSSISSAFDTIKSAPGKFYDTVKEISTAVASEAVEVFKSAKEKGNEWLTAAKDAVSNLYKKMAEKVVETYDSIKQYYLKNKEEFSSFIQGKKDEIQEMSKLAQQSADAEIKEIGEAMQGLLDKGKDVTKFTTLFILGTITLTIRGAIAVAVKVKEAGEEGAEMITSSIKAVKERMGEKWEEVKKDLKEAKSILSSTESKFGEEYQKSRSTSEGHIIKTFESFIIDLK
jgi:phage-related protein